METVYTSYNTQMAAKLIYKNMFAKTVREWFAFYGGEEMGVSFDNATTIWNAAIKAEKSRTSTNNRRNVICRWKLDVDYCYYVTSCGQDWYFPEGDPVENGLVFCPHCGKRASMR